MNKYILGYISSYSIPKYKNVIVTCLVDENIIIDLNRQDIIDKVKSTYTTKNIFKIISIQDKKMNNYENAINIFENDNNIIFNINDNNIISKNIIKFYVDKSLATFINLNYKVKKTQLYDINGHLFMDGVYIDGIFNGYKIINGIKLEYKDGFII
jgi:hypothetical protein